LQKDLSRPDLRSYAERIIVKVWFKVRLCYAMFLSLVPPNNFSAVRKNRYVITIGLGEGEKVTVSPVGFLFGLDCSHLLFSFNQQTVKRGDEDSRSR